MVTAVMASFPGLYLLEAIWSETHPMARESTPSFGNLRDFELLRHGTARAGPPGAEAARFVALPPDAVAGPDMLSQRMLRA